MVRKGDILNAYAKPFLKWAGGKTQLIPEIEKRLPIMDDISVYIEPFVGGGSVFFYLNQKYKFERCYLIDTNKDLILTYNVIKDNVLLLIDELKKIEVIYNNELDKEDFYKDIRSRFNKNEVGNITRAAYFIFLNKSCFNGLFRVNKSGEFNVPYCKKFVKFYDENNLKMISQVLKNTIILYGDFDLCERLSNNKTFIYFDPPYKPIKDNSFISYSSDKFIDKDQLRLIDMVKRLDKRGVKWMMSNSDDKFFDGIFVGFNIDKVLAKRMINCDGKGRGCVNELVVTNYKNGGVE